MKYRKKPIIIDAFQWTGDNNQKEDPLWIVEALKNGSARIEREDALLNLGVVMYIDTLEGTHRARIGDYIIQGVKGEIYPCKADIFEATYEPVTETL